MKYVCTHCNFETNQEKEFCTHLSSKAHLDQCKQSKVLFEQKPLVEKVEILKKENDQLKQQVLFLKEQLEYKTMGKPIEGDDL
mgnify:CR=1 FL=1